jgi:hypothetical protein
VNTSATKNGCDRKRSILRARATVAYDSIQGCHGQTLFNECVQGQVQWFRPGHREIVNRTVNSQGTDVAPRELERLHGETVGCNHDFTAVEGKRCRVCLHIQAGAAKMAQKNLVYQLAHEAAAVTVCKADAVVFHQLFRSWPIAAISAA